MPSPKKHLQHGSNHCICFLPVELVVDTIATDDGFSDAEAVAVAAAPDKF